MKYFQQISVWKTIDSTSAVKYICFQNLENKKYCVQSADFFHAPVDEKQLFQSEKQIAELFIEIPLIERCEWFPSLEAAIAAHELDFS